MIENLLTVPCTIIRRSLGPPDAYNDPTMTETREPGVCYWQTTRSDERGDTGATEQSHVTVFLPATAADLDAVSAVEVSGGPTVEAFGPPRVITNARTGEPHHVELLGRETA